MNIEISKLKDLTPGEAVRIVTAADPTGEGAWGLYQAAGAGPGSGDDLLSFYTAITALSSSGLAALTPAGLSLPVMLPVDPLWDIQLSGSGKGYLASAIAGGAFSFLRVNSFEGETLSSYFSYEIEAVDYPSFVIHSGEGVAKQPYIAAIFSDNQLGIIGLQAQDGMNVPGVSSLVGSSDKPVSAGRVWGDLSAGLPAKINLVYKINRSTGPLAPGGQFCGQLFMASYDTTQDQLGQPVALLEGLDVAQFDIAVSAGIVTLFATTGDGSPLLAQFDETGKPAGTPTQPPGSWSNAGRWAGEPSIIGLPGVPGAFGFAFFEFDGPAPASIQTGMIHPIAP